MSAYPAIADQLSEIAVGSSGPEADSHNLIVFAVLHAHRLQATVRLLLCPEVSWSLAASLQFPNFFFGIFNLLSRSILSNRLAAGQVNSRRRILGALAVQ